MTRSALHTAVLALGLSMASTAHANDVRFFEIPPTAQEILHVIDRDAGFVRAPATSNRLVPEQYAGRQREQRIRPAGKERRITLTGTSTRLDQPVELSALDAPTAPRPSSNRSQPDLRGNTWFAELVQFTKNSNQVRSSQMGVIVKIAEVMRLRPNLNVIISGHADVSGGDRINRPLSMKRAEAVRQTLNRDHGIAMSRMKIRGASADEPVAGLAVDHPRNRRVQFGFPK